MAVAPAPRFSPLLRWMGITLVVLLAFQMLAVLGLWQWDDGAFRQGVVERLIAQAPMALVGLVLMYLSSRLEDSSESRSPVLWSVCIISGLLAVLLTASLPVSFGADQQMQMQVDQQMQQLKAGKEQLTQLSERTKDPAKLKELIKELEAAGRLPAGLSEEQKASFVTSTLGTQLDQVESQSKKIEQGSALAMGQLRWGGSATAVVLIIAFTILCLGSVL